MHSLAAERRSNQRLCEYLRGGARPEFPAVARPDEFVRPYEQLGTHPDLVVRLWDELTVLLPGDCRFVLFGRPVLLHPESEVAFGLALGTQAYALRLPEVVLAEAIAAGASRVHRYPGRSPFDLDVIGPEWMFCNWHRDEDRWCLAAYELAGTAD